MNGSLSGWVLLAASSSSFSVGRLAELIVTLIGGFSSLPWTMYRLPLFSKNGSMNVLKVFWGLQRCWNPKLQANVETPRLCAD